MGCHTDLSRRDLERTGKLLYQRICKDFFVCKCHKGVHKANLFLFQGFYIIFNVFRIGGDHGAVIMVSGLRAFVAFIGDAGIEDKLHTLADEP